MWISICGSIVQELLWVQHGVHPASYAQAPGESGLVGMGSSTCWGAASLLTGCEVPPVVAVPHSPSGVWPPLSLQHPGQKRLRPFPQPPQAQWGRSGCAYSWVSGSARAARSRWSITIRSATCIAEGTPESNQRCARRVNRAAWARIGSRSSYTILPKVLGRPLLMSRFDYFSNFYEYKS